MSSWSSFKIPATYHLLSYGTLLGTTFFHPLVSGLIGFRVLPRAQFSTLQKHSFPLYFAVQTVTPLAMLFTYPLGASRLLPFSRTPQTSTDTLSSWLIGTMFVTSLVNWVYMGPQATRVMGLRKHQETRDGKKSHDAGPHSKEMESLNRQFEMWHGLSTVMNVVGFGAMIWYGGVLGEWLRI